MKAYVVEDTELARVGLELILARCEGVIVAGSGTPIAALNRLPAIKPDVVIIRDTAEHLSVMESVSRKHEAAFLMISSTGQVNAIDAIARGVRGVASAQVSVDNLALALSTVAAGHVWIDDQARAGMRTRITRGPTGDPLDDLTETQQRVAQLVAQGMTNRQIASEIHVADKTVKNYVAVIMRALEATNRTQVALMVSNGKGSG